MANIDLMHLPGLREKQDAVRRESERVVQLGAALVRSKNILVVLTTDVADIDSRLDQFASQWAQVSDI